MTDSNSTTGEDKEEEKAAASLAAAKGVSKAAAVTTVWSELDGKKQKIARVQSNSTARHCSLQGGDTCQVLPHRLIGSFELLPKLW